MTAGGRSTPRLAALATALAAAALWFAAVAGGYAEGAWLAAKVATMPALAVFVAMSWPHPPRRWWIVAALVLHGSGDLLIEIDLLAGIAVFFVGHWLYLGAFWRHRRSLEEIGGGTQLGVGALALVAASVLALLSTKLSGLLVSAVPLYVAALAAMCGAAWWTRPGRPWVPLGATLFVLSDALLGWQLFAAEIPGGRPLVWLLYVGGQTAIAVGWSGSGRSVGALEEAARRSGNK